MSQSYFFMMCFGGFYCSPSFTINFKKISLNTALSIEDKKQQSFRCEKKKTAATVSSSLDVALVTEPWASFPQDAMQITLFYKTRISPEDLRWQLSPQATNLHISVCQ